MRPGGWDEAKQGKKGSRDAERSFHEGRGPAVGIDAGEDECARQPACRADGGRLDLLVGKTSVAGDPLRPSRLLLNCADEDLPRRIEFLFRAAESARTNPPWQRAWRLEPRRVAVPERVWVTALRACLECPLRFYLGRVLQM